MPKVTASSILENFRKGPRTDLVIQRINKIEKRKREDEDAQLKMQSVVSDTLFKNAELRKKFEIAKIGGFKGSFFKSLFNPAQSQAYYELGIEKVKDDPSILDSSNWLKALGKGIGTLVMPKLSKPWDFGGGK